MAQDDDPRAPYKVYEGDELKGTYATRAEARRRQQQLEGQQAAGSGPVRHLIIKDNPGLANPPSPIGLGCADIGNAITPPVRRRQLSAPLRSE